MTNPGAACTRCGVLAGPASTFRRSLCEGCATERSSRRQTRSAITQAVVLVAGLYVWFTGSQGAVAYLFFVFAFVDVVGVATTVVHETAHASMGLILGFKIREISIGIGPQIGRLSIGKTRLIFRLYPLGGHTGYIPRGKATRIRALTMIAAGPLSHLLLARLAAAIIPDHPSWLPYRSLAVSFILMLGLLNLVPFRGTDGWSIVKLLLMPDVEVAGFLKTGEAVEVAIELQAVESGSVEPSPQQRDAFLTHLGHPTTTGRDRAISLNNLAVVDLYLEDPELLDEADRASEEAMALLPDLAAIRNTRGAVLIAKGDDAAGIALIEPTIGAIPAHLRASSHAALALAHARSGRVFDARRHIAAAREVGRRSAQLDQAEILAGPLEIEVARRYLDGRSPQEAAALVRSDAGALAPTMGRLMLMHIETSGEDGEVQPLAEVLVVT
ncbi:MAG: site-2 protease family protein [Acidimicrobiia bacterium]